MQDPYAGQAGTFVVDPDKGVRVPIAEWQAEQAAKEAAIKPKAKPQTTEPKPAPQPETE